MSTRCLPLVLGLFSSAAYAVPDDFDFELEGYYRTRGYVMGNLVEGQDEAGRFVMQRLRIEPRLNFQDRAKFFMQMDMLDDSVWGDNSSLATTALFAGEPSNVGLDGDLYDGFGRNNDTIKVKPRGPPRGFFNREKFKQILTSNLRTDRDHSKGENWSET